jgi:hypothetical protein
MTIKGSYPIFLAMFILWLLAGCDERITAVTGTDLPFTLYGLLSPDLDAQKALIYPVEGTLLPRGTEPLDAVVRSINLETGGEHVWRDSLVTDALGLHEHVFEGPFQAEFGHAYRLTVTRSDGATSTVETTVPPATNIRTGPAVVYPGVVTLPAIVEGGAPHILKPIVVYFVTYRAVDGGPTQLDVAVDYNGKQRLTDEGWVVSINLAGDYETIERAAVTKELTALDRTFGIRIDAIKLQLIVASMEWNPPGGDFDPEVIVQPGTMSNVENGHGFLAAGYRHDTSLDLPEADVLRAARFMADPP